MRLAYELGFTNARLFTRGPVRFLALDKIAFAAPVPIGSILRLRSRVLYSESSARWPALVVRVPLPILTRPIVSRILCGCT
jgi:acyl-coenzyme A thioesterase 9